MKLDILAFGAHPDDIELSCSGTLLKHISLGYKVGLCDLTQGELGSRGNRDIRMKEAEEARQRMGALIRENLNMEDGFFDLEKNNILKIVMVIRKYKPEIILANALSDRHPDHGRAAKLVNDSCFFSGLTKIETHFNGTVLDPWRPRAVYHYVQDRNTDYDFVVDISPYFSKKMELILTFGSQFNAEGDDGPATPISSGQFMRFMESKNRTYGRDIQVEFAEAFKSQRDIGVENLFHLL